MKTTKKRKWVRILKTTWEEDLEHGGMLPAYRVELYLIGLGWETWAGFPTMAEAKAYRRTLKSYWESEGKK